MKAPTLALLLLLLAGCGAFGERGAGEDPAAVSEIGGDGSEAGAALAYYDRVRKLGGAELAREQETARRVLARTRSDGNRMRYALALAVPAASRADAARALEIMEPVTRNAGSSLHALAQLVTAMLQEQRRLEGQAQGLQQKLDALLELERQTTGREGGSSRKR